MANVQDRLSHAADVTKWKWDQQARIMKAQNKINDFENQIRKNKALLTEDVYAEFLENRIENEVALRRCNEIKTTFNAREIAQSELDTIKNEQPPKLIDTQRSVTTTREMILSGLVCPICKKELVGKYCPDDGLEGVERLIIPPPNPNKIESDFYCPKCGKPVELKYCVNCGLEGVKREKIDQGTSATESGKGVTQTSTIELVCPICSQPVENNFCNIHGKRGIPREPVPAETVEDLQKVEEELPESPLEAKPDVDLPKPPVEEVEEQPIAAEEKPDKVSEPGKIKDTKAKFVCPKCGKELTKKFCKDCGIKGIMQTEQAVEVVKEVPIVVEKPKVVDAIADDAGEKASEQGEDGVTEIRFICPKCGKGLSKKFCKDCGREGIAIPKEMSLIEYLEKNPSGRISDNNADQEKRSLVCPNCGRIVVKKYCSNCGIEGVKRLA